MLIGITETGDPAFSDQWKNWVIGGGPAILITKHPNKLLLKLRKTDNIIIHCTITGYGGTVVEPNVPKPEVAIEGYKQLIKMFGEQRVVLRVDPIFPSEKGKNRAVKIMTQQEGTRIRISFLDAYDHVKTRFKKAGLVPPPYKFNAPLKDRIQIHQELQEITNCEIEVCGEPGFKCIGCISHKDCKVLGVQPTNSTSTQRPACSCLAQKKQLVTGYSQCPSGCLYCYLK